ncbi:hypothetical protein A3D84_01025 [Candidatus Woesebacteria bacterium RIFCSPHIGHO2_02_FULL_42_20]|nr:MAG: hypothetical protein A3D84_01025 [Candidatus Woesebacteria bacterium RIFCSPHIGHO2_02_FULL_42_20]
MKTKLRPVIGLEVHIEQNTKTKMFCGCPAIHYAVPANTHTCPVCLGLPGALPKANKLAVENILKLGLALGCKINLYSKFDRKHYFYPDLPKGYQITQYEAPFCSAGRWEAPDSPSVNITRIHLEEDTGKLIHKTVGGQKLSLVDFNRSGVPLIELVTGPDFETSEQVTAFLKEIRKIVRHLGISTADMDKGSMRLEANVSVSTTKKLPDYKVELKNINSFKFLAKAVDSEIARQTKLIHEGKRIAQETRGFDEAAGGTLSQRTKEEAKDYRYFPEPDLPPIRLSQEYVTGLKTNLPKSPSETIHELASWGVSWQAATIIVKDRARLNYLYDVRSIDNSVDLKSIANLIVNKNVDKKYKDPNDLLASIVKSAGNLSLEAKQMTKFINEVLIENPKAAEDFRLGKTNVVGFLLGKFMQKSAGRGDPKEVSKRFFDRLK